MSTHISFDKYEVVLLIEAYEMRDSGILTERQAIQLASDEMRMRAIRAGVIFDKSFSNYDGIRMQMKIMTECLNGIDSGLHKASTLFS